jgi:hypothetical protein
LVHTSFVGYPWISPVIPLVGWNPHGLGCLASSFWPPKNAQNEDFKHENGGTTIAVSSAELDQTVYCVYMYACMYMYINMCVCAYKYIYIYIVHIYMYMCMCIYVYIDMYVQCMCIYI